MLFGWWLQHSSCYESAISTKFSQRCPNNVKQHKYYLQIHLRYHCHYFLFFIYSSTHFSVTFASFLFHQSCSLLSSSPLLSPFPSSLLSFLFIQHQRAPVAPVGWPLASHFLPCSAAIQRWRALSGLSRPQGVRQKPRLGAHRRFLLI